jgi:hypothetical protein
VFIPGQGEWENIERGRGKRMLWQLSGQVHNDLTKPFNFSLKRLGVDVLGVLDS